MYSSSPSHSSHHQDASTEDTADFFESLKADCISLTEAAHQSEGEVEPKIYNHYRHGYLTASITRDLWISLKEQKETSKEYKQRYKALKREFYAQHKSHCEECRGHSPCQEGKEAKELLDEAELAVYGFGGYFYGMGYTIDYFWMDAYRFMNKYMEVERKFVPLEQRNRKEEFRWDPFLR